MAGLEERPTMPTKEAIARWWWHHGWDEAREYRLNLVDFGEPCCWACGTWRSSWTSWHKASLERCHIVPHALGGTNDPSNYVLLCKDCHLESPDTPHREAMLTWIRNRPPGPPGMSKEKVLTAQKLANAVIGHDLDPDEFLAAVYVHLNQCVRHFGDDGPEFSPATVDWAIAEALTAVRQ